MKGGVNRSQKSSVCVDFHHQWQFLFNEDLFLHHKACFKAKTQNSHLEFLYTLVSVCSGGREKYIINLVSTSGQPGMYRYSLKYLALWPWLLVNFKLKFYTLQQNNQVQTWKKTGYTGSSHNFSKVHNFFTRTNWMIKWILMGFFQSSQ